MHIVAPFSWDRSRTLVFGRNQEALPVIVEDPRKHHLQGRLTFQGPGGVSDQNVDLARFQGGKSRRGCQRNEFDLPGIPQDGGSQGPAEIRIHSGPAAVRVLQ